MAKPYTVQGTSLIITIKAVPASSKTCLAGLHGDRLRIKIAAAPEDGKANAELLAFLAQKLGCAKKELALVRGEKAHCKNVSAPSSCIEALERLIQSADG